MRNVETEQPLFQLIYVCPWGEKIMPEIKIAMCFSLSQTFERLEKTFKMIIIK